jgi:hypothetical protein
MKASRLLWFTFVMLSAVQSILAQGCRLVNLVTAYLFPVLGERSNLLKFSGQFSGQTGLVLSEIAKYQSRLTHKFQVDANIQNEKKGMSIAAPQEGQ